MPLASKRPRGHWRAYRGQVLANCLDEGVKSPGTWLAWDLAPLAKIITNCLSRFYLAYMASRTGGLDTRVYTGTAQEGKADIYFCQIIKKEA